MDIAEFDQALRHVTGEHPRVRPFVCEGSPLTCSIFFVGLNPATDVPFWPFWDVETGFAREAWYAEYLRHREDGKPSITRQRMNRAISSIRPIHCLETNLFPTATKRFADLPVTLRSTAVFDFLVEAIRPAGLLVHGAAAVRYIQPRCSGSLSKTIIQDADFGFGPVPVLGGDHLTTSWKDPELQSALSQLAGRTHPESFPPVPRHDSTQRGEPDPRSEAAAPTRSHDQILERYFVRRPRVGWQALLGRDPLPAGYRTSRVGKLDGSLLLFTIGETELGRSTGLDRAIESAIRREGAQVQEQPSTSGSLSRPKVYPGVDLRTCSADQLESLLSAMMAAVRRGAEPDPG
jgi:hypothetical protein